jgi:hypothetical protein
MDIAKYIGLYLLKNHFCYLHGLGNLQLRKKPATYNGEALTAPQYEVTLSPGGSIDDNLANFIATAEQTSISKAANNLRDFISTSRAELQSGNQVVIPAVGYFIQDKGVTRFVTDPNLSYTPPNIPALKMSKRLEEPPSFRRNTPEEDAASNRSGSVNWGKIAIMAIAFVFVIVLVILGIRYLNQPSVEPQEPAKATPVPSTAPVRQQPAAPTVTRDTIVTTAPVTTPAPAPSAGPARIVLNTYPTRAAAEKRLKRLRTTPLGNTVSIVAPDSARFMVVIPYSSAPSDSTRVLDSFSRMYGSKATIIR